MANAAGNGRPRGVVVVGASAGGVEALTTFAEKLPPDLPYAILVALHMPPSGPSVLARIIDRSGPLPAIRQLSSKSSAGTNGACSTLR